MKVAIEERKIHVQDLAEKIGWSRDKLQYMLSGHGKWEPGEVFMVESAMGIPRGALHERIGKLGPDETTKPK